MKFHTVVTSEVCKFQQTERDRRKALNCRNCHPGVVSLSGSSAFISVIASRWAVVNVENSSLVAGQWSRGECRKFIASRWAVVSGFESISKALNIMVAYAYHHPVEEQRGRVVGASDLGSGDREFDSRPRHIAIALGKQFALFAQSIYL
ncbi:hypothetical protein ElyMa_001211100 [Elysia marginata]|uniref:Uncharacterized protein n=1 Tax=Elysia marginata TaxID=1093978 RepID=A0AAV4I9W3_9GAST|nr:hypothetical protein ElyMa_001211100 [Elysia marginata]